ncbi:MAG: DinB family protein [Candidatus Eisenbacteria bacterium]|nr:DinB family protein [Candidatus Eisenbacteria bacterium]
MTQNTATEKDMFLQTFERECQTTLKILRAFPADKAGFRPAEKSRTAAEVAGTFVLEQGLAGKALAGTLDWSKMGPMPKLEGTLPEIITMFDKSSKETAAAVARSSEDDLNKGAQFPVGPGKLGDFRRMDILWMTLMDQVHHRGQLSVYLRIVGAKVPSIYGPSGDEPWM